MVTPESRAMLIELRLINSRVEAQGIELQILRTELGIQFKRIASLQAELDLRAAARRRQTKRKLAVATDSSHIGRETN